MRKHISLLLGLSLGLTAVCAIPALPARAADTTGTETVTMYRLYNPNSGEHFYTKDESEKAGLVKEGWNDEGIGWIAPEISSTPVYRLYNVNTGDHHYTTDSFERTNCINAGWNDEGIGWYSDDNKTVPLYREYNPYEIVGTHNYTTDKAEHDHLVSIGWIDEGIGWYAISDGKADPSVDPTDPTDPVDPVDPTEPKDPVEPKDIDDNLEIGDIVILGTYEQDNNLANGPEPIKWEYIGDRDGHKFLMAKYALDCKQYNDEYSEDHIFWEDCTLRRWLNNDFYNTAFSSADKKRIVTAHNENPDSYELYSNVFDDGGRGWSGGNDTDDNVFLLNWVEARDYLDGIVRHWSTWQDYSYYNPKLLCKPTPYAIAIAREVETEITQAPADNIPSDIVGCCTDWYTRSPGAYKCTTMGINVKGEIDGGESQYWGPGDCGIPIRPVILVD